MIKKLRAQLASTYETLRRGRAIRFGGVSLVRSLHFLNLLSRLEHAERELARSSQIMPVPLNSAQRQVSANGRRSVVFLHHSYYNFFYLAKALRKRGWDAINVCIDDPADPDAKFFHGEDLNLYDPVPEIYQRNLDAFFAQVTDRFRMVHFYGRGRMSFFPAFFDRTVEYDAMPFDFLRLRQLGTKIGYSVSGCLDAVAQSSVHRWSGGACDRCVWQNNARICGDLTNLAWGHKIQTMADVIATEGFPALDWQATAKAYREPLTTALDPDFWSPDLEVPEKYRLTREPGELIVYHAVGNFSLRSKGGRNLKGTGAVIDAVERLRSEGMKVRLEFVTDVPNRDVRFFQVQADVIVDQLNYGRYGATAREGMMLGRPTICYINKAEPAGARKLDSIENCPLVSADESNIYVVLRDLLENESRRRAIGIASRAFALKWHSADACAERFEQVYDRLMLGLRPEAEEVLAAKIA